MFFKCTKIDLGVLEQVQVLLIKWNTRECKGVSEIQVTSL